MNHRWRRITTTLGLLSCLAMVSPACVVRAQGHVRARATPVYVVDEAPPPPRYRTVAPRAGYTWVRGHWEWRGNQWSWVDGHWERERTGYVFEEGHWEQRGNRWHWIEGRWVASGSIRRDDRVVDRGPTHRHVERPTTHRHVAYPTAPPPAPRETQRPSPRAGYVWVEGRWEWSNGDWQWTSGHWERARTGFEWESGRWEQQGDRYVWVDGRWVEVHVNAGPKVRDHRRGQAGEPPGHARGPTSPPPAPRDANRPAPRSGYVWVEGRWQWNNGNWDWVNGHWERARTGYVWQPGRWEAQGGVYVWIDGEWVVEQQQGGPKVRDHRRGGGQR